MDFVNVKPLSVNECYKGRHFPTPKLKAYQTELFYLLPKKVIPNGVLAVKYLFGVSSQSADGDNYIKAFQDCLAEKYGFNDRQIYRWEVEKRMVPKGEEFVAFEITAFKIEIALTTDLAELREAA